MRKSALHRNTSIIAVALAAAVLAGVAVTAGPAWALPFVVALATMVWLETSARRGAPATSTVTQEELLQELSRPAATVTGATVTGAQFHSIQTRRTDEVTDLPEGHLAPVVQVDFRRRCAA